MLDRIIYFSIHNKLVIGLFTVLLIAWGSYAVTQLPIDAVPDITDNQVMVITVTPTLAAQEVERLITFPVEVTMATIPDIQEIRSFSRFGLSLVTVVFKEHVDIYWARQQIGERLKVAERQIPQGIGTPEMAPVTTGLGEIYQYVVHAKKGYEKKYSAMELRTIQDWIVRRQLLGTPGVAEISSFGGYLKQYEIAVDPDKLRSMQLSISDVFTALEKNNQNTGGAYIDKRPNAYFIRSEGLAESLEDLQKIVVRTGADGIPVLIRDVAQVQFGHSIRYGASTRNGQGEVVSAVVMMLKGENSSKVIKAVKARIEVIRKTLPEGVEIEPFLDRTKLVDNAIHTVTRNLAEGALIVVFVLVLMLGNLRAGLVVASVIPLAMLFAIAMMNLFGVSGNLMSLGAIDFGLIVDGAVIIVEATLHHILTKKYAHVLSQQEMDAEVYESASNIRNSAAFGEIIILIVYLPILVLVGIEGKMFRPMAQTVGFAILGAFILSVTYVPMVSALFLSKKPQDVTKKNISDRLMDFFQRKYDPVIRWAIRQKAMVVTVSVVLLAGSLWVFSRLGGEFIPTLDEGDFAVETRVLTGSSIYETIEATQVASRILLKQFPEVKQIVGKIGSGEIPTDPMSIESADLMIILKDRSKWTSAETREALAAKMEEALKVMPGVTFGFQQPIQMRFNELITGAKQDVVLKIYGEDLDVLTQQAAKIGKLIQLVKGISGLYIEEITGLPQISIRFNRDNMAHFGLNIADVNRVIRTAFAGETAGQIYEGEKRFDLVIRLNEANRQGLEDVRNLYVTTPTGNQVPLQQLAEVDFKMGPNQIQRDDTKRRISIGFNVRGRDVESIVKEIQGKVNRQIKLPVGYYVTYGGQFQNLVAARDRLSIAVPAALLLIFVLLYFTFYSIKQSLLIFTAIPLSAIGGILALWLRGMPFSISAGIGFIALFGVSVLNGIVLIGYFNQLRTEGMKDWQEIVLKGTAVRLRPVIMTALVASLGFLPMALSNTSGAEVQKPLATVVIGGLISATLLTLIVLPVLYLLFTDKEPAHPRPSAPKGGKPVMAVVTLLLGIFLSFPLSAQTTSPEVLTLEGAINRALAQNGSIRSASYEIEQEKALKKTASDLGKTSVGWNRGQYNSILTDNNFTITQNIPFPTVWIGQAALSDASIKSSELKRSVAQNELVYQVKSAWYQLAYAEARRKLLLYQDSLVKNFAKAADVRYRTGESTQLEKATADLLAIEMEAFLSQNKDDSEIFLTQLQTLLNSNEPLVLNLPELTRRPLFLPTDSAMLSANPNLSYIWQQVAISQKKKQLEQAKLLPDLMVGYFNQSLTGFQNVNGTEQYYGPQKRFSGFQLGLSVPLWFRPQAARIQAAELGRLRAQTQAEYYQTTLTGEYKKASQQYRKLKSSLDYYEKNALVQADLILKNAQKAFRSGEIGYMEYSQGLTRALGIKASYLEMLHQFNQSVLMLEWLAGN